MKIPRKQKSQPVINTTALPDIIFMLLFFFMVTTVIQEEDKSKVKIPHAVNNSVVGKNESNELHIAIKNDNQDVTIEVNNHQSDMSNYVNTLESAITEMRMKKIYLNKAKLWIAGDVKMQYINKVKEVLQSHDIRQLEYVHNYKP